MENLTITFLGKKNINTGIKKQGCNFYGITPINTKKDTVNHHILLLDVSGSMYGNIPELKQKVDQTLDALKEGGNNYVSVIVYSSHGECFRILNAVKCDDMSYKMTKVKDTIEKELYCRSLTVISEPLQNAIDISEGLVDIADKHHIILFTDGCVVPSRWGYLEEENKCYDLAKICKEKNFFLNAIGFGNYYDRNFLKTLTGIADGSVNHIDEIPQYFDAVLELVNKVNDEVIIQVPIENNDFFIVESGLRLYEPRIIKSLKKNEENIIVVFDNDLIVDGIVYPSTQKLSPKEEIITDLLYSLTLNHIIYEDVDSAEIVMAQTGDIELFKLLNNCYSFIEKGKVINTLQTALVDKETRFKSGKEEIKVLSPEEEPLCLLEIIDEIMKDKSCSLLWDLSAKYKRISQATKSIEDNIVFEYPKKGYMPITSIVIAGDKLNINVKAEISSQVLNKTTTMKMDAKIYKDYNLVKNGIINVDKVCAILSPKLKKKFKDFISNTLTFNGQKIVVLDLLKIKSTNKRMLRFASQEVVAQNLYDIEKLKVDQWAIKKTIVNLTDMFEIDRIDLSDLPLEVIEARKAFRIDEKGVYIPLEVKKVEDELFELYKANILEWKIEKFPKAKEQEIAIAKYNSLVDKNDPKKSFDILNKMLKDVQIEKKEKETINNLVRISSGLIGKPIFMWENTFSKDKKAMDKVFNMNMVVNGTMNVSTKTINNIQVREDKFDLLIKAN